MRYPLLAFLFVFVLLPFTVHAVLTGGARFEANGAMGEPNPVSSVRRPDEVHEHDF